MLEFHGSTRQIAAIELEASKNKDSQQRILRIYLNQIHMGYIAKQNGLIDRNQWTAFEADIRNHFQKKAIREHWKSRSAFYPNDFREFITESILNSS